MMQATAGVSEIASSSRPVEPDSRDTRLTADLRIAFAHRTRAQNGTSGLNGSPLALSRAPRAIEPQLDAVGY